MTSLIFVYGTLLAGEPNHYLLAEARFVGSASTEPKFSMYDFGGFPAVVAAGVSAISGEIYEVDETTLAHLDLLERHPRWYLRTAIVASGRAVETYLLPAKLVTGRRLIASGSWRRKGRTK